MLQWKLRYDSAMLGYEQGYDMLKENVQLQTWQVGSCLGVCALTPPDVSVPKDRHHSVCSLALGCGGLMCCVAYDKVSHGGSLSQQAASDNKI